MYCLTLSRAMVFHVSLFTISKSTQDIVQCCANSDLNKGLIRRDFLVYYRCGSCVRGFTHIKWFIYKPTFLLLNSTIASMKVKHWLSPKHPCSKKDISPEFWSTVSERFSLAPIEMASKHSKEAPGSKKCCLRLKFFKISWNGVTVQTRPSIEGSISFPGSA